MHALRGDQYEAIARSEVFPELELSQLLQFVTIRPTTRAVRALQASMRARVP